MRFPSPLGYLNSYPAQMKFSLFSLFSALAIIALAVALACVSLKKNRVVLLKTNDGLHFGQLSQDLIDSSPVWPETDKNPPLSVRDAISISDDVVVNLDAATKPQNIGKWELNSLHISPIDGYFEGSSRTKWCYVAHFVGYKAISSSGPPIRASIIIMMDGSLFVSDTTSDKIKNVVMKLYPENAG